MVFDRFRKKRSRKEMQDEIDALIEEEKRLDLKIGYDKISKRISQKRHSQSTIRKIGRGFVSLADTVFGGPPPKTTRKTKQRKSTRKKKKEDDFDFFPFI